MRAGFKATECVESTKGLICEARALLQEEGSAAVLAQVTSTKSSTKLKSELTAGPCGTQHCYSAARCGAGGPAGHQYSTGRRDCFFFFFFHGKCRQCNCHSHFLPLDTRACGCGSLRASCFPQAIKQHCLDLATRSQ